MNQQSDASNKQSSIDMRVAWRPGARTPAWNDLWRQIIADLGDALDQSPLDGESDVSNQTEPPAAPRTDKV